ncbi:MAG: choice-of-anchor E domain-containing protein [Leptolyngbya sp. PLA1]|nr:choice-of-anchor E domain-containing protein [Leptolyngbya sp. PLA1]
MNRRTVVWLTVALAVQTWGGAASAEVFTQTQTVSNMELSPWITASDGGQHTFAQWNPTVDFARFDTSLGSLTGVTITVQTGMGNLLQLIGENPQHNPTAFGYCAYSLEWSASITPPGTTVVATDHRLADETFGATLVRHGTSVFSRPPSGPSGLSTYNVDPVDFSLYSGPGAASFALSFDADFNCTELFNCSAAVRLTSRATLTVDYEFTPVPAPGPVAALVIGGLLSARRRR